MRSAAKPWPTWGYALADEEPHRSTEFVQTEPNGLIYMRGRFYSPAWHCFLNSDQGADKGQWSQYAYAHGNPMINTDPSGMFSWGGWNRFWHDVGHSASVNWSHARTGVEIGAAVALCIAVDYCSLGTASETNPGIMGAMVASTGSAVTAVGGPIMADAGIGFVAGGLIGAKNGQWWSWNGACKGLLAGAAFGYGFIGYQDGYEVGDVLDDLDP